jgi:hypothetical protein
MPTLRSNRSVKAAGTVAAVVAGALLLNDKYGFSHDIKELSQSRTFKKRLETRISQLGDDVTIYRMLELAQPNAPALWFEGRTWTYAELRSGM